MMFVKFLVSYFSWFVVSANAAQTRRTVITFNRDVKPPKITPVNDSFVLVNYHDTIHIHIEDFSQVTKIEFYELGRRTNKLLATACKDCRGPMKDVRRGIVQPLMEGKDLLANMSPCVNSKKLFLKIETQNGTVLTTDRFENSIDFLFEERNYTSWICYEDSNIVKSQNKSEIFHVRLVPIFTS